MSSPIDAVAKEEAAYLRQLDLVLSKLANAPTGIIEESIRNASATPITRSNWFLRWLDELREMVRRNLGRIFGRGVDSGLSDLPQRIEIDLKRDVIEIVERNAPLRAADYLRDIAAKTRAGIRRLIRRASGHYLRRPSKEKLAKLVLQVRRRIGLTPAQLRKIEAFELKARGAGLAESAIEKEVGLRVARARAVRARGIVSQGTAEAINEGRRAAWERAIQRGLLPPGILKRSRDQRDGRVRKTHEAQSAAAPIPFNELYARFGVMHPPFERGCRCWEEIVAPGIRAGVLTIPQATTIISSVG